MMINSIEASAFTPGTCYVAGTRYKMGDFTPYLYKTEDYGQNWTRITQGIPGEHFTRVLREDPKQKGLLYAGTENGMYISFDDGGHWLSFQQNLPLVPITDLTVKDNSLIVATQGRSLWMVDDLTVIHQALQKSARPEALLYKPKDSYRVQGRGGKASLTAGTNLSNGVIFHYYLKNYDAEKDTVAIEITEADGTLIKRFATTDKKNALKPQAGGNQWVWDMRYDGAERLKGMIFWSASFSGAKAVPGEYKAVLTVNGASQTQDFTILPSPKAEATIADMKAQFTFVKAVNTTVDKAHKAIKKIRALNKKLKDFEGNYKDEETAKTLISESKALRERLAAIEKALYQTQNRSNQDPLNFPIRLTNKLGHLNRLVTMNDFPPTAQDEAVRKELTLAVEEQLTLYQGLMEKEVKAFNANYKTLQLDYLKE